MIVCFIGHRTIANAEQIKTKLLYTVSTLIADGADTFLFGSKSQFDSLCWQVITELQKQHPNVKRVSYNTPHETAFTSRDERQRYEQIYLQIAGRKVNFREYDNAIDSQKAMNATKDTYIMRNQDMIDDSDVCVFYYDKDYLPPKRKQSPKDIADYQPQSGTAVAFAYAKQKKKRIINVFTEENTYAK